MAKGKTTAFFCQNCGYESAKWMGQCPACREWNTFVEEPVVKTTGTKTSAAAGSTRRMQLQEPSRLVSIKPQENLRISTGMEELDRVLGGGIVTGSLVLVGGDPGIGKSTLLLQVCKTLANRGKKVLYISGEESVQQIKIRADRVGEAGDDLLILCETNLGDIRENSGTEQTGDRGHRLHPDHVQRVRQFCSGQRFPGPRGHRESSCSWRRS